MITTKVEDYERFTISLKETKKKQYICIKIKTYKSISEELNEVKNIILDLMKCVNRSNFEIKLLNYWLNLIPDLIELDNNMMLPNSIIQELVGEIYYIVLYSTFADRTKHLPDVNVLNTLLNCLNLRLISNDEQMHLLLTTLETFKKVVNLKRKKIFGKVRYFNIVIKEGSTIHQVIDSFQALVNLTDEWVTMANQKNVNFYANMLFTDNNNTLTCCYNFEDDTNNKFSSSMLEFNPEAKEIDQINNVISWIVRDVKDDVFYASYYNVDYNTRKITKQSSYKDKADKNSLINVCEFLTTFRLNKLATVKEIDDHVSRLLYILLSDLCLNIQSYKPLSVIYLVLYFLKLTNVLTPVIFKKMFKICIEMKNLLIECFNGSVAIYNLEFKYVHTNPLFTNETKTEMTILYYLNYYRTLLERG